MLKIKISDKDKILLKCNQHETKLILNSINESCELMNKRFSGIVNYMCMNRTFRLLMYIFTKLETGI